MKKLVFIDLDGTMCQNRQPVNKELVKLVNDLAKNCEVCIVSGAVYEQLKRQIKGIKNVWVSPQSGCVLYDKKGVEVYTEGLTVWQKVLVEFTLKNNKLPINGYLRDKGCQMTYYCKGEKCPYEDRKDFDPRGEIRKELIDKIGAKLLSVDIKVGGTHAIDFTPKGIGKRYVVETLRSKLGFKKYECLYVGDKCYPTGNDWVGEDHEHRLVNNPAETEEVIENLLK